MTRLRAPHRTPSRGLRRRDSVFWLGAALVLVLVALLPLALALMPVEGMRVASGPAENTSSEDAPSEDKPAELADIAGIGSGAGELSAAALSALHRDLNAKRTGADALASARERIVPHLFAASTCLRAESGFAPRSRYDPSCARVPRLATPRVGPGPDGIPLLF